MPSKVLNGGAIKNNFGYCYYIFEEDYVLMYNLFVYPEFRRQGKAREILHTTINAIRKTGYTGEIQGVVNSEENYIDNKRLTAFYESIGLKIFTYYG